MAETPVTEVSKDVKVSKIHTILRKNLKSQWMPALGDYTSGKIGKLKLIQILGKDLVRMETELQITVDLLLKQRAAADLKPLWEDNLRTKAILGTLLEVLEEKDKANSESANSDVESIIQEEEELHENIRSILIASESKV